MASSNVSKGAFFNVTKEGEAVAELCKTMTFQSISKKRPFPVFVFKGLGFFYSPV